MAAVLVYALLHHTTLRKGASTFDRNMVLSKHADARSQLTSTISPLRQTRMLYQLS